MNADESAAIREKRPEFGKVEQHLKHVFFNLLKRMFVAEGLN